MAPYFAKTLEQTLHNALGEASRRGHKYATLEHLLLGLIEDPNASEVLKAAGVDLSALASDVKAYVDKELSVALDAHEIEESSAKDTHASGDGTDPTPTSGFQRVVQRAILHVQSSGRNEVNGANVLVALFSERESYAVYFLNKHNITRLDAVTYISKGVVPKVDEETHSGDREQPTSVLVQVEHIFKNDLKAVADSVSTQPILNTPRIAEKIVELAIDVVEQSALKSEGLDNRNALLTIGIYGPWGSGKSTLLRAIGKEMSRSGFVAVHINTWKWDGNEEIYAFVNRELLRSLSQLPALWWRALIVRSLIWLQCNIKRTATWIGILVALLFGVFYVDWSTHLTTTVIAKGSLLAVASGLLASVAAKPLGAMLEKLILREPADLDARQSLSKSYRYLDFVRRMTFKRRRAPIVFLFDDLDRCDYDTVVSFVKSIHSLTADGSISVVACDEEFTSAAIYNHFKAVAEYLREGTSFGRRFLEKIVQIPFRLPEVTADDLISLGLSPALPPSTEQGVSREAQGTVDATNEAVTARQDILDSGADAKIVSEVRLTEICGRVLRLVVEPCHVQIRQAKMLSNVVKLYSSIFPPLDEATAERMAAFLVVSYLESAWIPNKYFGMSYPILNSGLDAVEPEIRAKLGEDAEALTRLYRLFGVQFPRAPSIW